MSDSSETGAKQVSVELRAIIDRVVGIRKELSDAQGRGLLGKSVIGDALQLAETIEKIGEYSKRCNAEDLFWIAERIRLLLSLLETEMESIFTPGCQRWLVAICLLYCYLGVFLSEEYWEDHKNIATSQGTESQCLG